MSAVWRNRLRRLLQPTLGKKFLLIFSLLALTAVANGLVVEASLAKMHGTAALVNVTGSLRWLSQRVQLDVLRGMQGNDDGRASAEAGLVRIDEAIRSLELGGSARGFAVLPLPEALGEDIAAVRRAGRSLRHEAESLLALSGQDTPAAARLAALRRAGDRVLDAADAIAAALTTESQRIEDEALRNLRRLGLLDLAILVAVLLAVRLRVVRPLRRLAALARDFAAGRHERRSGFRSQDEIGLLAAAFDGMADEIERDLRQLAADAVELGSREQALRKFSLAVEHSPVSVMITDASGTIEYVNPKFAEITGHAPEEAVGRRPAMLEPGQAPPGHYEDMWRTLLQGCEWHGELLNRKRSGELFWEDTRISLVKDAAGRVTHFVLVKEDITARKQAEEAMLNLNAELERRVAARTRQLTESNRELESFSYSISHDLRAPLRGINGFASLMAENCKGCQNGESVEYLERIRRASVHMGGLIDDLLDLSRLVRKEIAVAPLDLSELARAILDGLAAAEPARAVQAEVQDGLRADGDATLLRAALENLLGNAWKFSARRNPARIAFGCHEEGGVPVYFVRDNGAGFDMRYAGKLFGTFQRLHGPREFEGNGIGLAMVRRIITLHGGEILAESAPDCGATFRFSLGAALPARNAPKALPPAADTAVRTIPAAP